MLAHRRFLLVAVALAPVEAVAPLPTEDGVLLQPEALNPFVDAFNAYVPAVPPVDPYKVMDPYELVPTPAPSAEPSEPCDGKEEGNDCKDEVALGGQAGYCKADGESDNGLSCRAKSVCEPASKDDPCTDPAAGIMSGICESDSNGGLVCHQKPPCKGKLTGDSCEDPPYVTEGHCKEIKYGGSKPAGSPAHYCQQKGPCFGKDDGNDCTIVHNNQTGLCVVKPDYDYCTPKSPCTGANLGDPCSDSYWKHNPDTKKMEKTLIEDGACVDRADCPGYPRNKWTLYRCGGWYGPKQNRCIRKKPCQLKHEGESCSTAWLTSSGKEGYCVKNLWSNEVGWKALNCYVKGPCYGASEGDDCVEEWIKRQNATGYCKKNYKGSPHLTCMKKDSCYLQPESTECQECHSYTDHATNKTVTNCYPKKKSDGACKTMTYDAGKPTESTHSYCSRKQSERALQAGTELDGLSPQVADIQSAFEEGNAERDR